MGVERSTSRDWWLLVAAGMAVALLGDWRYATVPQFGLYLPALAWLAALLLFGVAARRNDVALAHADEHRWQSWDWVALLSILVVASFFRLWRYHEYPPLDLFGFEEFQTGGLAAEIIEERKWVVEFPLTNLLPAIGFVLFGKSSLTLRLPFVLASTAAAGLLFMGLRRIVALPAAWFAALLLAGGRWPAVAARFADELFFPLVLVAAAFWLLVRAVQRRRQLDAVLLAIVISDFFYAYSGYRIYPLLAFAAAGYLAVLRWRTAQAARTILLAATVCATLLGLAGVRTVVMGDPLLFEAIERHDEAWQTTGPLSMRVQTAIDRMRTGWAVFASKGDDIATVNIPNEPMLDPVTAGLAALGLAVALLRCRDPKRLIAWLAFAVPFAACGLLPVNFNASRYFVLLVPLYLLIGLLMDDLLRWSRAPRSFGAAALVALGGVIVALNFNGLQRLIDSPTVRSWFIHPESTVVAAVRRLPAGATARLLTNDCGNALERSHYRWFTEHVGGGRGDSLYSALDLRGTDGPLYWVTQWSPEARVLPEVIRTICPEVQSEVLFADHEVATIGLTWVDSTARCTPVPPYGLQAVYFAEDRAGRRHETAQIDPALMAYTIPFSATWQMIDRQLKSLTGRWRGTIIPRNPGRYNFRLEATGVRATFAVGEVKRSFEALTDDWRGVAIQAEMTSEPIAVQVGFEAIPVIRARVRLYWTPPGESEEIIPPQNLRPAAH